MPLRRSNGAGCVVILSDFAGWGRAGGKDLMTRTTERAPSLSFLMFNFCRQTSRIPAAVSGDNEKSWRGTGNREQ